MKPSPSVVFQPINFPVHQVQPITLPVHAGKIQVIGQRVDLSEDLIWVNIVRRQLLGFPLQWDVLRSQPHPLICLETLSLQLPLFGHLYSCLQCMSGPLPSSTVEVHQLFYCWDPYFLLLVHKHGGCRNWHLNGDMPKGIVRSERRVQCQWVLWAYFTQPRYWSQGKGFTETRQLSECSRSWFTPSAWPFDLGWNSKERLVLAPRRQQKAFQVQLQGSACFSDCSRCKVSHRRKLSGQTNLSDDCDPWVTNG